MGWRHYKRRAELDAECALELEMHIAFEIEHNQARGMTPEKARTAAHRKLGNSCAIKEKVYRMNSFVFLESLWQDIRFGFRVLRKNPGFTAVALASLSLGIGANAALFQLVNAVMLRNLPVRNAEELVRLKWKGEHVSRSGNFWARPFDFTYPEWEALSRKREPFSAIFAWSGTDFNLAPVGETRRAKGLYASGDLFQTLGVTPAAGRLITRDDDRRGGATDVAVISHSFWQREYGGKASVLGSKLTIEGHPFEIVGVAAPWFTGVEVGTNFDVAVPISAQPKLRGQSALDDRRSWWVGIFARLKPGVSAQQASTYLQANTRGVLDSTLHPGWIPEFLKEFLKNKIEAVPGGNGYSQLRGDVENPLWMLLAIAGLVLLIACANLANLMLARAAARQSEIAIRLSLGASRGRVIRQLLSESMLLAVFGCALGALLAQALSRYLIVSFGSSTDSPYLDLSLDWRTFGFMVALAVLSCLLFGLVPALRATRNSPAAAMKADGRGITSTRQRFGLQRILVVSQIALSLILVLTSLLFIRSFTKLMTLDPGFREEGILVAQVGITDPVLKKKPLQPLDQMLENMRHSPGIDSASSILMAPLSGGYWNSSIRLDGASAADKREPIPKWNRIADGYFRTMATPLYAGRDFNAHDAAGSPEVAIVDQSFVDRFYPKQNVVGKVFHNIPDVGGKAHQYQIVGVVKRLKYESLQSDFAPMIFLPLAQEEEPNSDTTFVVHSQLPLGPTIAAARSAVDRVTRATTMEFHSLPVMAEDSMRRESLMAKLSSIFGLLAIVLATIGLYGVKSYIVAQRRHEIGLRLALGADRPNILRMMLTQSSIMLAAGLVVGTLVALAAGRAAQSLLFQVKANDPATFVLAIAGLTLVSFIASLIPALRAAGIPPMAALREE
jgi:putative ABC transport system permease protein